MRYNSEMRAIPGHDGFFVDVDGRVFSEWTMGRKPRRDPASLHELRGWKRGDGHIVVSLGRRTGRALFVHRLVALAFMGPCPEGQEVRHLNGQPDDNRLENLAYGTRQQNVNDSKRHGTFVRGERSSSARLTEEDVRAIRLAREKRVPLTALVKTYGVSAPTICDITKRRTWAHVA